MDAEADNDVCVVALIGFGSIPAALDVGTSLDRATGMATCVTIVRAAPEAGSAKLTVSVPTAATAPSVVCANLWIENDPVT